MKICNNKIIRKYILYGILFGLMFPITANIFEIYFHGFPAQWDSFYELRNHNPILLMIDTAPVFLGVVAYIAGRNQAKSCEAQERFKKLATYDELTSLYNRRAGKDELAKYIEECPEDSHISLFYIDLDNFKLVNDTLGHGAGDKVLISVSQKLKQFSSSHGFAMRVGGDEFIVALKETIEYNDLEELAVLFHNYITTPLIINNQLIKLNGSIGIARFPHDALTIEELMFSADAAMFEAKRGQIHYSFYNDKFKENYKEKLMTKASVLSSVEEDHFHVIYQPIINLNTMRLSGIEALIRWNNPEKSDFYPSDFIPMAEENDGILKIAYWTLSKVCMDMVRLHNEGMEDLPVTMNISESQMVAFDFVDKAEAVLEKYDMDHNRIKLEINTKTKIMNFYDAYTIENSTYLSIFSALSVNMGACFEKMTMVKGLTINKLRTQEKSSCQTVKTLESLKSNVSVRIIVGRNGKVIGNENKNIFEEDTTSMFLYCEPLECEELISLYKKK